ncbi:MAG: ATPase domain-containing protein [Candidatus ainarchaeum sp.]|nr:ATPase domain-containing protein [Candidatus ainarchaeum sp.]
MPELDSVMGGGFPSESVVLLAGSSGSGKTLLCFQWLFEGVKNGENGIYISITEPLFKSLKNLETMRFYDREVIESEKVKLIDIRDIYGEQQLDYEKFLHFIEKQIAETNAKRLCIDSITAFSYNLGDKAAIRSFIFDLGKLLGTLGCTTVLTSEVTESKKFSVYGVEEFISDVIIRLDQLRMKGEIERIMQIIKVRGRAYKAGDLYFKIADDGITVFPHLSVPLEYSSATEKTSSGLPLLDEMLFGGVFRGSSTLVAGSTGTGKTLLGIQFLIEGLKNGEPCLYAGFEESRDEILRNAKGLGWNLEEYEKDGLLVLRCSYPNDKFIQEHLADICDIVKNKKIKRCTVDSLSALSNSFPEEIYLGFAKKLNANLKTNGVTTVLTKESPMTMGRTPLTENGISAIIDNILLLRHVEMEGELNLVLNVLKARGSPHSKMLTRYMITSKGIGIGASLAGYEGIMTGVTRKVSESVEEKLEVEFKRFLGPMGDQVFGELSQKGLSEETLTRYVDSLVRDGILKADDAKSFKEKLLQILKSGTKT